MPELQYPPPTLNLWCQRNDVDPRSWPFGPLVTDPPKQEAPPKPNQ